jgi:hypothetical protein
MSVTINWTSGAVRAMRKELKLRSDCGDSGSKKCKRGDDGANGGVWRSLRLAGVCSQFCVSAFGRNLPSVAVKMFSHLIYFFFKKFYKFCTFSAICKDNAAINCITVQHKSCNLDGPYGIASILIHRPLDQTGPHFVRKSLGMFKGRGPIIDTCLSSVCS